MRLYNVVHILVGTPGRVLDLADKGIANLKECTTLIMDEARYFLIPMPPKTRFVVGVLVYSGRPGQRVPGVLDIAAPLYALLLKVLAECSTASAQALSTPCSCFFLLELAIRTTSLASTALR